MKQVDLACNTVLRVKPRRINVCGSLNCSFIMAYAMLTTFILVTEVPLLFCLVSFEFVGLSREL